MNTQVVKTEAWPAWAKALLIGIFALAVLVTLPWVFMWTTMAAACFPAMNGMGPMMGPGMGR